MKAQAKYLAGATLVALVLAGGGLYATGTFDKLQGDLYSASSTGSLTISVDSATPRETIVIAGKSDVPISTFEFTSTGEAFLVSSLSINNRQSAATKAALGDYDNNVVSISLQYTDSSGATASEAGYLVNGTAEFSGLDLYIAADDSAKLEIYADLNSITSSGSSATAGEFVDLTVALSNFEAVGQDSGDTFTAGSLDNDLATSSDLDIGTITWSNDTHNVNLAVSTLVAPGAPQTLLVDDGGTGDPVNLPVGTLLCASADTTCSFASESVFVVSAWTNGTTWTDGVDGDTVITEVVNDADTALANNDNLIYALPGTGFFTASNPMHVYETKPTFALASSSPSGSRSVSSADDAFVFTVTADGAEKVMLRKIVIDALSDADFNLATPTKRAYLKESGTTVATGAISYKDTSRAVITFDATNTLGTKPIVLLSPKMDPIEVPKGTTKTFVLTLDSGTMLDEDPGKDDPLTFSIDAGYSSGGVVTAGGIVWSDTNAANIKWLGYLSTSYAVQSNTVKY